MTDDLTLGASATKTYWFRCASCGRQGRHSGARLLRLLSPETAVSRLPKAVARASGCAAALTADGASCGAAFDLAAQLLADKRAAEIKKMARR